MNANQSVAEIIHRAFPGISALEAENMAQAGATFTYGPGKVLCQEGALEQVFYILLDGEVDVTKLINDTEVKQMKNLRPGDFFGEMALIHHAPRAATVTTTTPVRVLEINQETFQKILQSNSSVSMAMVREVSRRLRENDEMAIEDLRMKARELANTYQQLAEMDFARREFLTTIAHELRTPLTAANGFLQMARMGLVQGDMLTMSLETVARNLGDIITLVNDILFLQEMDLILLDFQPTDIGAVVGAAVEQQRTHAERNQVGLNLNIAPDVPRVQADRKSLERAMLAILDNAVKFSPDGGDVQVNVYRNDGQVWVEVCDHGVGIPPEVLPHIFDRFFHTDKIGDHLFRGVGLGLSIARQVIEQHGGAIDVQSQPGAGSTFFVKL